MRDYELAIVQNGRVYVETKHLLDLTNSPELRILSGEEFSDLVRAGIVMLEALMKIED